jgi:thioesterase domain-containing protein/acyl carrier protein
MTPNPLRTSADRTLDWASPLSESSHRHFKAQTPVPSLEEKMRQIWADVLKLPSVGMHDDFFESGGHSLLAVRLFARLEKAFGKKLPLATLFEHPTVARLARVIRRSTSAEARNVLIKMHEKGSRPPLFFAPSAGADYFYCRLLARHLGSDQPVWSYHTDDEAGMEAAFSSVESLAALFVDELMKAQRAGPYCVAGYSFGAAVALEMAQQLTARGQRVAILGIIDGDLSPPPPRNAARILRAAWSSLCNLPYWLIDDFLQTPSRQRSARLAQELREVARRLYDPRGGGGTPPDATDDYPDDDYAGERASEDAALGPSWSRRRVAFDASMRAMVQYTPRPYRGRVTLFRSRSRSLLARAATHDYGWSAIAAGGVDVKLIPGSHVTMVREPFVRILARELRKCLDKVALSK